MTVSHPVPVVAVMVTSVPAAIPVTVLPDTVPDDAVIELALLIKLTL